MFGRWGSWKSDDDDFEQVQLWVWHWYRRLKYVEGWVNLPKMLVTAGPREPAAATKFFQQHVAPLLPQISRVASWAVTEERASQPPHSAMRLSQCSAELYDGTRLEWEWKERNPASKTRSRLLANNRRLGSRLLREQENLARKYGDSLFIGNLPCQPGARSAPREEVELPWPPQVPQPVTEASSLAWNQSMIEWQAHWDAHDLALAAAPPGVGDGIELLVVPEWEFTTNKEAIGRSSRELMFELRQGARWAQRIVLSFGQPRIRFDLSQGEVEDIDTMWRAYSANWRQEDHRYIAVVRFHHELYKDILGRWAPFSEVLRPLWWE